MAFQIWDDIRDLVCDDERLGKPAGHDLVEGTYTLPVLRALACHGVGDDLRALLGGPLDAPTRDKARDLVLSLPRCCPPRATPATGPSGQTGPSTPCALTLMGAGWPSSGCWERLATA